MINPRLVSRVERSLRKRLNTDIRALLDRYASRADTEEAFVAAAGRLLLDPRERQQWLAAWAQRLHTESHDTSPVPLDGGPLTLPPDPEPDPEPRGVDEAPPTLPNTLQLDQLRDALAYELGPIAFVLLEREAARATSTSELRDRLHGHLDNEEQRARFLRNTQSV